MKRVFVVVVFSLCFTWLFATDYVAITEVMYDTPLNEDTTSYPHCIGEYIELYNAHNQQVDLSDWSLQTINPDQIFIFPKGTFLPPNAFLLIAYGTVDPYNFLTLEQEQDGKTFFHTFYSLLVDSVPIITQTNLRLYNAITPLVLKDNNGRTRDSLTYHAANVEDHFYACNTSISWANSNTSLCNVYSVQRITIRFNLDGTTTGRTQSWGGYQYAKKTDVLDNNSVGCCSRSFFVNILETNVNNSVNDVNRYNYIQEIIPRKAMSYVDTSQVFDDTTCIIKRTYCDAMYRPTLTFHYSQTPNLAHVVTLKEYDGYARPTKDWLPIATEIDYLTAATFQNNVKQYYSNESRPFMEKCYSTTAWNNDILQNELIGSQKAGADMGTHKMSFSTRGNDSLEVKLFNVNSSGLLCNDGYYLPKQLLVTETIDEDNKKKVVYTNLRDQIVMEKVDNATTYYVYNDLNQLCYVLPPLAANQLDYGTYGDTIDCLKKYAYVYKYDQRGNQIYKRLPGCEPVLMVYDKSNLLVMSQTGNQCARGTYWTVYKYDALKRPIYTAEINTNSNNHDDFITSFSGWVMLEHFSTESQNHPMSNTGYSRGYFHNCSTKLLTVNYYDNYKFLELMSDTVRNHMQFSVFEDNDTCCAKGLLTGTRTYYLDGSGDYSETVYYYDYRGREIQRRSTNHLDGYDVLSTKYDFVNNITNTWATKSTRYDTITEHYQYSYDHANRPTETIYKFNDESPIVLQSYHYDELGRVRSRHLHGGIDSVAFCYDIRNQITQIKSSNYEQKYYFNQTCPIGNGTAMPTYNGNVSATTWTYGNKTNGHMYYYDKMDRLVSNYSILNGSLNADYLYSERFSYDAHGNITSLMRWDNQDQMDNVHFTYHGNQLSKADDEYDLYSYSAKQYHDNNMTGNDFAYDANGNMIYDQDRGIAAIRYNLLNLPDTIQFTNGNQIVHRYDAAGNRLETNYYTRKVTTTVPLGNTLKGTYNILHYNITRDAFHNNIVYTANNNFSYGIEFVHNPEGYIRYYGSDEHYHFYYIKDLLGNIRETYIHPEAGYKECVQRMQYYPSGLPWVETVGTSEQPYKYNSKEFIEMHGLDEYDSKARWYYPAICRTATMDPLAETYYPTSPYAWCGNNPVNIVDPDGRELWRLDINTGTFIHISDEGKDETDYYQIGTMINNEFAQYATIDIPRGSKDNINVFRYEETENSTISAYHIPNSMNGDNSNFFLERPGPDSSISGKRLRIPQGAYMLAPNPGSKYLGVPRLYLDLEGTDGVFWTRGILIHTGNVPTDTEGCLLPGEQKFIDRVSNSRNALSSLHNYITAKQWNVQLNIYNVFPYEK